MSGLKYFTYPNNLKNPKKIVFLLHGYGSNGNDLISLAPDLVSNNNDVLFVSPHAPHPCEMGFGESFQWFSLLDRSEKAMTEGAYSACEILYEFVQEVILKYSVKIEDCALLGFSQGSMMTMYTTISKQLPFACILCFSGKFLRPSLKPSEVGEIPPALIVHGELDEVVPVGCANEAKIKLVNYHSKEVDLHLRPHLGHGIDLEGIELAKKFLKKHLLSD